MTEFSKPKRIILNFSLSFYIFIFSFLIFTVRVAEAARLYFEPQEQVIGEKDEFSAVLNIDAEEPVNAISLAIFVSEELTPIDTNDGSSIINLWLEKPHFDEASRLLTFSGIIPGGFKGEGAPLLIVKLKAEKEIGIGVLSFNKEKTKIYLNTPYGIEDELELEEMRLPIIKGKENIIIESQDNEPPETFKPEITRDPMLFENKWSLVFTTHDKLSGMAGYFVHETTRKIDETRIDTNKWIKVESPYILKDQGLKSWIYIKAIDKAGNERIEILLPKYPLRWYERYEIWVIIILGVAFIFYIMKKVLRKRHSQTKT